MPRLGADKIGARIVAEINQQIEKDGGARYRELLNAQDKVCLKDRAAGYLGPSQIGKPCTRAVWFSWRKYLPQAADSLPANVIRLFTRGHAEEPRVFALLELIGIDLCAAQLSFSKLNDYYGGHVDNIIKKVPGFNKSESLVLEVKTHNDNQFNGLVKLGVAVAQPSYYAQINQYLKHMQLGHCLYFGVNKNNDKIYCEVIAHDEQNSRVFYDRAKKIIFSDNPPGGISLDYMAHSECKKCKYKPLCTKEITADKKCKTCAFSTASKTGRWLCRRRSQPIPHNVLDVGCSKYKRHAIK